MPLARIRKVSPRITAIDMNGPFQVAVFLVQHERGLALVDAGFPGWHYAVLAAIETFPWPNRITHVILTHAHADHVGSASEIARAAGAEIVASALEKPFIEGAPLARAATDLVPRVVLRVNHWLGRRRVPETRVGHVVDEGDVVCGLRVIAAPGHTPGQVALVHDEDRVVLCADTLFNFRDQIGHDPVPGMTIDARRAESSMARIAELGIDHIVPSHGPALVGDAPARIRRFLESRSSRRSA
jgi:glyoxylase-like metal-dependent hydrolase (beta-lactamase superfamily II)